MKKLMIAAAPLALLGACSGGDVALQPGEWEMTTSITDIEAPGAPEQMVEMMRTQLGQADTDTNCLTDADSEDPLAGMLEDGDFGDECDWGDSSFAGGVINVNGTCAAPGGQGNAEISFEGTYTATSMDAEIEVAMTDGPMGDITMSGTMNGERTGECSADGEAEG
ncbi:MAG: DUF3617 domain-containing protein [Sphingomonadaceae bacterium]|nr:DUF3617 domain-containing protein [Sphingomonadaceae bacterium]